ncbi:hypothetical protein LTR17_020841 [Elasticomyces elasticus]|nr:hypothetical protein LTR17_020841 [Elasticomyces elasticus]
MPPSPPQSEESQLSGLRVSAVINQRAGLHESIMPGTGSTQQQGAAGTEEGGVLIKPEGTPEPPESYVEEPRLKPESTPALKQKEMPNLDNAAVWQKWKADDKPACQECKVVGLAGKHPPPCDPAVRQKGLDAKGTRAATSQQLAPKAKAVKEALTAPATKKQKERRVPCERCGVWGHKVVDCRAQQCNKCNQRHQGRDCPRSAFRGLEDRVAKVRQPLKVQIDNMQAAVRDAASTMERRLYQSTLQELLDQKEREDARRRSRSASPKEYRRNDRRRERDSLSPRSRPHRQANAEE